MAAGSDAGGLFAGDGDDLHGEGVAAGGDGEMVAACDVGGSGELRCVLDEVAVSDAEVVRVVR